MSKPRQSISFDRIADRYDDTRGGLRRGRDVARAVEPQLTDTAEVLEVGVGTGAVAVALTEMGRKVVGIDLSPNMLARAQERLGPRVANADAHALPFAAARFDNVYVVWVFHLVADPPTVMAECARVLRPGGRLVVAAGRPQPHPDGMTDIVEALGPLDALRDARVNVDAPSAVQAWASAAGLRMLVTLVREERFDESPVAVAAPIENRAYSYLWSVDEHVWRDLVQPVIDALRALPDQDRKRPFRQTQPLLVFER